MDRAGDCHEQVPTRAAGVTLLEFTWSDFGSYERGELCENSEEMN